MWAYNVMEGTMFQTHQATELSSFVDGTLELEARIAGTNETINAG